MMIRVQSLTFDDKGTMSYFDDQGTSFAIGVQGTMDHTAYLCAGPALKFYRFHSKSASFGLINYLDSSNYHNFTQCEALSSSAKSCSGGWEVFLRFMHM